MTPCGRDLPPLFGEEPFLLPVGGILSAASLNCTCIGACHDRPPNITIFIRRRASSGCFIQEFELSQRGRCLVDAPGAADRGETGAPERSFSGAAIPAFPPQRQCVVQRGGGAAYLVAHSADRCFSAGAGEWGAEGSGRRPQARSGTRGLGQGGAEAEGSGAGDLEASRSPSFLGQHH